MRSALLDEHHTTTLRHSRKNAVQYAKSHERLKRFRAGAYCSGPNSSKGEPEQHRQTAEVRRKRSENHAASAQHEHVADLRVVDDIRQYAPSSVLWDQRNSGASIVSQKGSRSDDEEDNAFGRPAPIQSIIAVG